MTSDQITVGARIKGALGTYRVLAVAEGYAMLRRPRCIPFVMSLKDIAGLVKNHADNMAFYADAGDTVFTWFGPSCEKAYKKWIKRLETDAVRKGGT